MSGPTGLRYAVLESGSRAEITRQGLGILSRGAQLYVFFNVGQGEQKINLLNDAPTGGTCEATSYVYLLQDGLFIRGITSD